LLKSYYLSDNFLFYSRVDSFKQFLRDTKSITNDVKREHSSFIRFLARLNKVKDLSNRNDITKLEGLQVQILKTRVLKEKEWLLAKIKSILL